jgi:hypothetical protein
MDYYNKKLKYEYKYNLLKNQHGGGWFDMFYRKKKVAEKPGLPIIHLQPQLNISGKEIDDITSNDYYHLFGNNSNPDFNERIFRLFNNPSFILYKNNDVIKKTFLNANTLLSNFIIERINYNINNTCLVSKEIYIYYNWYLYSTLDEKYYIIENKSLYNNSGFFEFSTYIQNKIDEIEVKVNELNEEDQLEKNPTWDNLTNYQLTLQKVITKASTKLGSIFKNENVVRILYNNIHNNRCNNYVYIPIVLSPSNIEDKDTHKMSSHANGILINIKNNPPTWIRIEPQSPNYSEQVDLNSTFERIVLDVTGAERCIHLQINEVCPPQNVTKDKNCMFWSLLTLYKICDMIIGGKDPIKLENEYNAGLLENLKEKMDKWKHFIIDDLLPECLNKYHFIWPIYNELFTNNNMIQRLNQLRSLTNLEYIPWFFSEIDITVHASEENNNVLRKFEEMQGIRGGHDVLLNYFRKYKKGIYI